MAPDILQHASLPFPKSLPEFQRLFPDDAACADYLERIRWERGFVCPHCGVIDEPWRMTNAQEAKRLARSADAIPLTSETTPTGTGRAWRADE